MEEAREEKAEVRFEGFAFRRLFNLQTHASLFEASERAGLRAERAEARYRGLVEKLRHAIVWEADPSTLELRFVSATAMSLLGYEEPPAGATPVCFLAWVHVDERELVAKTISEARAQVAETS